LQNNNISNIIIQCGDYFYYIYKYIVVSGVSDII